MKDNGLEQTVSLDPAKVAFASWNPNELTPEQFAALKEDIKDNGLNNPIDVMVGSKEEGKTHTAVDGNNRLRAVQELRWAEIRARIKPFKDDAEAMLFNFNINGHRGQHNPYKEAEIFKELLAAGKTQQDLARELHVDRTLISKRIGLLKIDDAVRNELREVVPRITVSHLELISPLPLRAQRDLIAALKEDAENDDDLWGKVREGTITVKALKEAASEALEKDKERNLLADALRNSKYTFKKCPYKTGSGTCGKDPVSIMNIGLPHVRCPDHSSWSLRSGLDEDDESSPAGRSASAGHRKAKIDDFIRSTVDWKQSEKFSIEPKSYSVEALKDYRVVIRGGSAIKSPKDQAQLQADVEAFLKKYGPRKVTVKVELVKKRGRPRGSKNASQPDDDFEAEAMRDSKKLAARIVAGKPPAKRGRPKGSKNKVSK